MCNSCGVGSIYWSCKEACFLEYEKLQKSYNTCIPDDISDLNSLEYLNICSCSKAFTNERGNHFVTLPSLKELSKLVYLNLDHCKLLKYLPDLPVPALIEHGEYWSVGMYIFNCPELHEGETERCSDITFSWMKQFILANQESSTSCHWIEIVIPGSEIPSWFGDQNVATSISINPSPIIHDNNVIGIVCCVLFSAAPHGEPTTTNEQIAVLYREIQ
ncbi:hypothetical protein MTR_7g021420 [Medicago truncatula]|uniref:C-JID domain-containing protein n=1 Tax=Medicago truncatula TaxID=3880 RepID=G7KSZ7_MEDTR|nr:hypothetical protein MTR_7g021420 [Medicago truncatula]